MVPSAAHPKKTIGMLEFLILNALNGSRIFPSIESPLPDLHIIVLILQQHIEVPGFPAVLNDDGSMPATSITYRIEVVVVILEGHVVVVPGRAAPRRAGA